MAEWVVVAKANEFPPGTHRIVDVEGVAIAVFNIGGEYYAVEDLCTHDNAELASGTLEGDQIICPRHGARFCVRNGEALTPPAYEALTTFPVRVNDAMVQVKDDRWD